MYENLTYDKGNFSNYQGQKNPTIIASNTLSISENNLTLWSLKLFNNQPDIATLI